MDLAKNIEYFIFEPFDDEFKLVARDKGAKHSVIFTAHFVGVGARDRAFRYKNLCISGEISLV